MRHLHGVGILKRASQGAVRALSYDRTRQVTLGGLIGPMRFKILEGRGITNVVCPKCGNRDSWEHSKVCYQIVVPSSSGDENWPTKNDRIVNLLCAPNAAFDAKLPTTGTKGTKQQPKTQPRE